VPDYYLAVAELLSSIGKVWLNPPKPFSVKRGRRIALRTVAVASVYQSCRARNGGVNAPMIAWRARIVYTGSARSFQPRLLLMRRAMRGHHVLTTQAGGCAYSACGAARPTKATQRGRGRRPAQPVASYDVCMRIVRCHVVGQTLGGQKLEHLDQNITSFPTTLGYRNIDTKFSENVQQAIGGITGPSPVLNPRDVGLV